MMIKPFNFLKPYILILFITLGTTGALSAKSCLWKVTSDTSTLYLQGSMHLLKPSNYPLDPAIEAAYFASDSLILEVDMKVLNSIKTQQMILKKSLLPRKKTLKTVLNKEIYQELEAACSKNHIPIDSVTKFKPWFVTTMLTLVQLKEMGFDQKKGLDTYFFERATKDQKKIIGLETAEFQIDLLDQFSTKNPSLFVARSLADLRFLEQDIDQLSQAWVQGDIETVGTLMDKSFINYPEFYNSFVSNRNKRWMKPLNTLLSNKGTCMVVVGAGHLPGENGLLSLLHKKGYTLEQL